MGSIDNRCELTNLTFPDSFFEDEVREGFFVTSMMKRYWASQLKVLSLIAQICDKHGIRWFAEYGTLLGTVRHEGYIPWDDDLDIVMLREDFERFFEVAEKELPEGFKALTLRGNAEYEEVVGRVVNIGMIDYGNEHLSQYYGCPYTIGVDIFPGDGLYDDEAKEKDRVERAQKVLKKLSEVESGQRSGNVRELLLKIEQIYRECPAETATRVALMPFYTTRGSHVFSKDIYKDSIDLPFENTYIKASARFEEMLELEYGDFLRIVKSGGVHEYPVYADQERMLKEHLGRNPFRYTLDAKELLRSVQRYVLRMSKEKLGQSIDKDSSSNIDFGSKKKAVLLPCKAKWWHTMEPLWKKYSQDPSYEVHVLPIFYYDCDFAGNIGEKHDERLDFPQYVPVEDCEKFDFEGIHPDVIVTQVPYDGYSTFMTVHEFFYSANLQNFTDELIYVPYFEADAPERKGDKAWTALSVMVEQEAVINADRVIVNSENMRGFYVDVLVELCGAETKDYWEQKIQTLQDGSKNDSNDNLNNWTVEQSNSCKKKDIAKDDPGYVGNDWKEANEWHNFLGHNYGRKVVIYHISIAFLLRDKEKSIAKIRRALETFMEAEDKICAIIIPQEQILTELLRIDENLWQQYQELVKVIEASKNCIYDEHGFSLNFMEYWNGYYGDATPLVRKCVLRKIPVMIENMDI
ncbi:LicD family protein [Butyrivibrio sp. VCB2006]|uniref:LicD family protein n=1 Tax=Butyrivibrio sp. VCB2006 TaxID=1280679 RepID=UPI0004928DC8|nr:LicD family protein [Butyrivibrio sp. VCB2006]